MPARFPPCVHSNTSRSIGIGTRQLAWQMSAQCPAPCSTRRPLIGRPARVRRGGIHERRTAREIRHAQEPDIRARADPDRLAGLVLLHRPGRRAGAGRARAADRADPADPVHVPGGLSLQTAAADRQSYPGRRRHRHLRLFVHLLLFRIRAHRDLCARLLHAAGFHRRAVDVPAGDGAVPARPSGPVLDQCRPGRLHALGLSQPDRFLLASRHELLPGRDLEHGRVLDRHLRPLRPARAHPDRRLPAAGRCRERLRRAARDDQRRAADRRPVQAADPANRGGGVERDRNDQRQRLGQRRRGRHHHHSADDALRRSRHLRRRGRDLGLDGRVDHAADDGGRRLPDVGIPRRALLGRRAARICARLRLLRFDRLSGLSPLRAPVAARCHREAAGAALRQGQDRHLLLLRALSHLSAGRRRQGRAARRALYRKFHARTAGRGLSLFQIRAEGPRRSPARRCSATSGAPSRRMPR